MKHPILKTRNRIFIYFFLWIMASGFQFLYINSSISHPSLYILFTILPQNLILSLMFIGAWFGLRYVSLETQKPFQFLFNHIIFLFLINFIWIRASDFIDSVLLKEAFNEYNIKIQPIKALVGVFSYLLFVSFMYLDAYYTSYLEKIENERKLYEVLKESELNLLKSQMNPHFLFNSLNSISSLTMLDAGRAQDMIIKLSDFLRYTVNAAAEQMVSLERELEMCKAYLDIEKVRFGNKIEFQFNIGDDTLHQKVPSMMLQTLFENAIKHGVYNSLNNESISFNSVLEMGRLLITISNSFDDDSKPKIGTKTGLKNVKNRLNLIYDKAAILKTETVENQFIVTLNLPLKS